MCQDPLGDTIIHRQGGTLDEVLSAMGTPHRGGKKAEQKQAWQTAPGRPPIPLVVCVWDHKATEEMA